jgi:hypothetical protein
MTTLPETYPEDALRKLVGMVAVGVLVQTLVATGCGGSASPDTHVVRKQTSAAAAAVLFSDNFTNTILPDKGLGTSWTLVSGLWYEERDTAISDLTGQDEAQENVASCLDCSVQATVTTYGVAEAGVFLRSSAAAPTTNYQFLLLSNGHVQIRRVVNGLATVLADVASGLASLGSPATLELTASGTSPVTLTGAVNSVTLLQVVDSSAAALTSAGYAGLWTNYAGVPFGAFTLTGASPPPPPVDAGAPSTAPDGRILFQDNFSLVNSPDQGLGPKWTLVSGLWFSKGEALSDLNGPNQAQENVAQCLNCTVVATVTSYGTTAGIFARSSSSHPTTYYAFLLLPNGHVQLQRVLNGVATVLADAVSVQPSLDLSASLTLIVTGAGPVSLTGIVNGIVLLNAVDNSGSAIVSPGYAGLRTNSAGVPFNDFNVAGPNAVSTPGSTLTQSVQPANGSTSTMSMAVDSEGNVIQYIQDADAMAPGAAQIPLVISKSSSSGVKLWQTEFPTPGTIGTGKHAIVALPSGDIVFAVNVFEFSGSQQGNLGWGPLTNAVLVDLSPNGAVKWHTALSGPLVGDLAVNSDGYTLALVVKDSTTTLTKVTPSGGLVGSRLEPAALGITAIAYDPAGNIIAGGNGLMKFDANGNLLWQTTPKLQPGPGTITLPGGLGQIVAVGTSAAGTAVGLGIYNGTGTWGSSPLVLSTPTDVAFVAESNGRPRWAKPINASQNGTDDVSYTLNLAVDPVGQLVGSGAGSDLCPTAAYIFKYDLAGDFLWEREFAPANCSPAGHVYAQAIAIAPSHEIVAQGFFDGPATVDLGLGPTPSVAYPNRENFLINLQP